ncbi:hypothetical protein HDF11_005191 [Tunturiibacter psychrotolerans]
MTVAMIAACIIVFLAWPLGRWRANLWLKALQANKESRLPNCENDRTLQQGLTDL